jgi:DNA-binding transcriptional ArsR family regulator
MKGNSAVKKLSAELDTSFFKALAEPTRVALMLHLMQHSEQDIDTIAAGFPQDRSVISRHLQVLLDAEIVTRTQQGRRALYQLNGPRIVERLEALVGVMKGAVDSCCPAPALVTIKKK